MARNLLANLQEQITVIEGKRRAGFPLRSQERIDGGLDLVDGLVPGKALSPGGAVEIIGGACSGKVGLAIRWLKAITSSGQLAVWFDVAGTFYPPSAEKGGVVLPRLLVVRPNNLRAAKQAIGIVLTSGIFAGVVVDWGPSSAALSDLDAIRLCGRARRGRCALYVLTTGQQIQLGFRAEVRLRSRSVSEPPNSALFVVERARPPHLGSAPWLTPGSSVVFDTTSDSSIEPIWEKKG